MIYACKISNLMYPSFSYVFIGKCQKINLPAKKVNQLSDNSK